MNQTSSTAHLATSVSEFQLLSRLKAALIHLMFSALVAAVTAWLTFVLWFPAPFREISGGRELFTLVMSVDVILGPLLTFVIFNQRKPWKELARDLGVIAVIQVAGLGYGVYTLFEARPVVMALEGGHRLRVVRAIELPPEQIAKAPEEWRPLPWAGVQVVATRQPEATKTMDAVEMAIQGRDVGARPELWLARGDVAPALKRAAKPLSLLHARYPARVAELDRCTAATGRPAEAIGFLPLLARRTDWVALVDIRSGDVVGFAPFDGF